MRILIAHAFYRNPGGEDQYVRQQLEALSRDHSVQLLARRNADLSGGPSTWTRMTFGRPGADEIERAFDNFRPDVVHLHNAYPSLGPSVHRAARKRGIPLVMTVHNFRLRCPNGYMFTNGELCRRCEGGNYTNAIVHRCFESRIQTAGYASSLWVHRFVARLEKDVARFVAPSGFTALRLREWGIDSDKIDVIRNFTELPDVTHPLGSYGLYLGRMSPEKGLDVLIDALKKAGDPEFVMAGDGPDLRSLEKRAGDLGLTRIRFTGLVDRETASELTHGARYLVLPSRSEENAPLAALEALGHGKPIIASKLGGLTELVDEGRGIAVTPADSADLASAIQKLVSDEELGHTLGRAGRSFAEENLTAAVHVAALADCYLAARRVL